MAVENNPWLARASRNLANGMYPCTGSKVGTKIIDFRANNHLFERGSGLRRVSFGAILIAHMCAKEWYAGCTKNNAQRVFAPARHLQHKTDEYLLSRSMLFRRHKVSKMESFCPPFHIAFMSRRVDRTVMPSLSYATRRGTLACSIR